MSTENSIQIHATGEATGFIPAPGDKGKPITMIGTNSIRAGFDATCLQQALNARGAPGVTDLVLNPDAHAGYGAPVGCVLTSPTHIYPGPVGVDIKCSMSFLQLDLPADQVTDKTVRRALLDAILQRTPTGPGRGQRSARKARKVGEALGVKFAMDGASPEVLHALGIPLDWAERCEDAAHVGHDGTSDSLALRLEWVRANQFSNFVEKIAQLGSYGGGNHFGECEVARAPRGGSVRLA
jgi:tRNA-splicing ligase RtcB (3'-phosphate/5'-hydroxy nucleic acid ligase)